MKKILSTLLSFICSFNLYAQDATIQVKSYPKDFFQYPIDLPPSTAGTFGELRPNHFHSGLDFRTNQRVGYPVHSVAVGNISRLRVQYGGFGNAVYITHPNGFTSVYGHLQKFSPELAKLVRDQQYKEQKFDVDFPLPPLLFPVNKGQVIAWSGNTGASAGPHLHFELRDAVNEQTINPQLFGLTITDKVPPAITAMAVYQLDNKPFSEKTPHRFFGVIGAAGNYRISQTLDVSGDVGFGISTTDMNSASTNRNGPYSIELKLDGKTVYTFAVERFAFDQTHAINAYIDYPTFLTQGRFIQKCFIPPGSKISLYPQSINRGVISFNDSELHDVEYLVKDVAGNTSTLKIKVRSKPLEKPVDPFVATGTLFKHDQKSEFVGDKYRVTFMPGNLYDDLDFQTSVLPARAGAYSATYRIHNRLTPIHYDYELRIKPDNDLGRFADKAVIVSTGGICDTSSYENGYVVAHPHGFGDFYVTLDTAPPNITPVNIRNGSNLSKARTIAFRIGDNLSGIKTFNAKIDGKWVLMEHDYKTKLFSYTFDNSIAPGKHNFVLVVGDWKNNTAQFTADFNR